MKHILYFPLFRIIILPEKIKIQALQKLILSFLVMIFFSQKTLLQNVGIGTNSPHTSALLDMVSNNKGLSVPSMNSAQRSAVGKL